MTPYLLNFAWHCYGLGVHDYDYTLKLISNIINGRKTQLSKTAVGIAGVDKDGYILDRHDIEKEILADLAYYTWIDNFYVCHFGLWRLQGIFEGILKREFCLPEKLTGLKRKMDAVRKQGYRIDKTEYEEILLWGKLRNALTRNPPEAYRPHGLSIEDVSEYSDLVTRVTMYLLDQKKLRNKMNAS